MTSSINSYFVRTFGAVGDGIHNDTDAFQKAINQCHQDGGGTVNISSGKYLIGTLILKSRVTLHLEDGAMLIASLCRDDYQFIEASSECTQKSIRCGLIYAYDQEDIAITGRGKIVGQDKSFWIPKTPEEIGESWNSIPPRYWPMEWRPMLILFENCREVLIEQVSFTEAPAYAGWLIKCDSVTISQVAVVNDFYGPNTDGFHLSSCCDVHISNCSFLTGDDSLAVDGNGSRPAENISITHCSFNTSVNALRVYTGLDKELTPENSSKAIVRNLVMSDCRVSNAAGVVNITAETGLIENLSFSNFIINMEQEGTVFYLMNMEGTIQNIRFSQITAQTNGAATIIGVPDHYLESIYLENIHFQVKPKKKWHGLEMPDPVPSYGHHHFAPFSIFIRYVRNIHIRNVTFQWIASESEEIKSDSLIKCRQVENMLVENFKGSAWGPASSSPIIDWINVHNSILKECTSAAERPLIQLSGIHTNDIYLDRNKPLTPDLLYVVDNEQIRNQIKIME